MFYLNVLEANLKTRTQAKNDISGAGGLCRSLPVEWLLQGSSLSKVHNGVPELAAAVAAGATRAVAVQRRSLRHVEQAHVLPGRRAGQAHLWGGQGLKKNSSHMRRAAIEDGRGNQSKLRTSMNMFP